MKSIVIEINGVHLLNIRNTIALSENLYAVKPFFNSVKWLNGTLTDQKKFILLRLTMAIILFISEVK